MQDSHTAYVSYVLNPRPSLDSEPFGERPQWVWRLMSLDKSRSCWFGVAYVLAKRMQVEPDDG